MADNFWLVTMRMGYSEKLQGTKMIRAAARYVADHGELPSLTKEVYPAIADQFHTTAANAEHAMRYATRKAGHDGTLGDMVHGLAHMYRRLGR